MVAKAPFIVNRIAAPLKVVYAILVNEGLGPLGTAMKNITLSADETSADETILEKARRRAAAENTP